MYFARKHIASHRKTCYMYRYIRQCVYCDEMHPREEDHDCEEGRAARRKKRMQMMREKREREKKEQKALEKIAVPLKKISSLEKIAVNSDFVVDDYNVEGRMDVEETDGTFSECRLYRHKSKKRNVVLYFGNGLFEGIDLNYTFENGKLKDDDGQLITYVLLNHFHIFMFQLSVKRISLTSLTTYATKKSLEKQRSNANTIMTKPQLALEHRYFRVWNRQ